VSVLPHADPRPVGLRFSAPACGLGALASVLQILLLRESAAQFSGNELTYGFVFAAWLLWGGAGSLWASRREITAAGLARLFQAVLVLTPVGFLGLRLARPALGLTPGELVSPGLILTATLVLTFFLSAPLGAAFAFAAKLDGPATRTYVWESAGAAGGGLLAYLVLIPLFSNAVAAALWGTVAALFVFAAFGRPRPVMGTAAALAALAALAFLDGPSQRLAWRPFDLVRAEDSRYGRLQVIRTSEQVTLYDHGQKGFSYPDPAAAEEAVHFALLQRPRAGRILLIGGGAGGSLAEILKYPGTTVDYVELDPAVIGLADRFLPEAARASLHHSRVRLHFADGRAFLERIAGTYDAIIVDLPPPATAQLNRYYSLEFFRLVRKRLNPSGIFSFRVPSSEEYISPTLRSFLAMLEATLGAVFPEVRAVPGGTNIFLASDGPLTIEASLLGEEAKRLGIRTATTNPAVLAARLDPRRIERLAGALRKETGTINRDLRPAGFFFGTVLWSSQFRGIDDRLLRGLAGVPRRLLLDVPLALFAGFLLFLRLRSGRTGAVLGALAVMGITSMAAEIAVLVLFQTRFGFVYERIALLLAAYMAGLAAGAWRAARKPGGRAEHLAGIQFLVIALLAAARASVGNRVPEFAFFLFLGVLGILNGAFFVVAQHSTLPDRAQSGLGYGWDLLGSFAGAAAVAAILIPLAGLTPIFSSLIVLNSFALLALVFIGGGPR